MTLESLQKGDVIFITNQNGELHTADFLDFTPEGLYINFKGFGHLEVKWVDLKQIETITSPEKRGDSYGPKYKVVLWRA
ncbi:MAG: hypothetical protein NE330_18535 [Lentisphaeraceae bacterium]|nr:hypothetical protein [Lentisphaeraceae bacterium]